MDSQDVRCVRNMSGRYARELAGELRKAGHAVTPAVWKECQRAGRKLAKSSSACAVEPAAEQNALQALGVLLKAKETTPETPNTA